MRRLAVSACLATIILGRPSGLMETRLSPQLSPGTQAHLQTALSSLSRRAKVQSAGQTGRWRQVSRGNRELDGIACPSMRVCYAFGGTGHSAATWRTTIFQTKDAGKTWRTMAIHPAGIPLLHIACPSVQTCTASRARPPHMEAAVRKVAGMAGGRAAVDFLDNDRGLIYGTGQKLGTGNEHVILLVPK